MFIMLDICATFQANSINYIRQIAWTYCLKGIESDDCQYPWCCTHKLISILFRFLHFYCLYFYFHIAYNNNILAIQY